MHRKLKQQKVLNSLGSNCSSLRDTRDMLYIVMEQCKSAEKSEVFVQNVTCAPEPMAVLCNEQQLRDIERFCCDSFNFGILGIDPTFNLGDFSVTPIVYQNLLLQNSHTGKSPLMLGPLLVHYRKEYRNYHYFLSTLCALNRKIAAVKAVGTDGEKNLVDTFHQAAHIRCFRHLQQNVDMHLREQQFPTSMIKEYIHDIFGWSETSGTYHEGLVDCCDSIVFDASLTSLKETWDEMEIEAFSDRKSHKPQFHQWFVKWKSEDFRNCTLRYLREDIGLGSPPKAFYTNNSESINALLKQCTGYKKQQWALFNDKMKEAVLQQQREIEKAIIGYGEYRLRPQYSSLTVSVEKWFRMSIEQRQRCINKLNTATVHQYSNSQCLTLDTCEQPLTAAISEQPLTPMISKHSLPSTVSELPLTPAFSEEPLTSAISGQQASTINHIPASAALDTRSQDITIGRYATTGTEQTAAGEEHTLSVSLKDAIASTLLPYTTVEGIWKKAASLISEINAEDGEV